MEAKKDSQGSVHYFWPEARIQALRMYAADDSEPEEQFARSKRLAWMREFCMEAPSWLQTMQTHAALQEQAREAFGIVSEAMQVVAKLQASIDQLGAPPSSDIQDRWAEKVVAPRPDIIPLQQAPLEADPVDRTKPPGRPKMPKPDEKLPIEELYDEAHGTENAEPSRFRAQLEKLTPAAKAKLLGRTAEAYETAARQVEMQAKGAGEPSAKEATAGKAMQPSVEGVDQVGSQAIDATNNSVDLAPPEDVRAAQVTVKSANGKEGKRAPRTGFRMELNAVTKAYGPEVSTFVAHHILGNAPNTGKIRATMAKFRGTHASRNAAALDCASHCKAKKQYDKGEDVLRSHAGYFLEHENGSCSWWAKW